MLNLNLNARPDERFHLQTGQPTFKVLNLGIVKRVVWSNIFLADGTPGQFTSWWIIGNAIHWYQGNVKCDASRCDLYWRKQLEDGIGLPYTPDPNCYVMTTTPKERFAFRVFANPGPISWRNMGGA